MGNNQTDNFFIEKPHIAAANLINNYIYYWIDFNHTQITHIQILQQFVRIKTIENRQQFEAMHENQLLNLKQQKICIIASPYLPLQIFTILQFYSQIQILFIYCKSNDINKQKFKNERKIVKILINFEQLFQEIMEIQAASKENIQFVCQSQMMRVNRWMINWMIFQQMSRQQGKQDFLSLILALNHSSSEAKKYQKSFNINKIQSQRDKLVLQWIQSSEFFYRIPSQILNKIRDTFIFALIRQPLFDIYNLIKSQYALNTYPQINIYTSIQLNRSQIKILKSNQIKYIYFSSFKVCYLNPFLQSKLAINQFSVVIKLKEKSTILADKSCGGFYFQASKNRVILNINTPFQIFEIDHEKRSITVELAQYPAQRPHQLAQYKNLQLHKRFIRYLTKIIPGQVLSSYFNSQLQTYQNYVKSQLSILLMATSADLTIRKVMRRLQMSKVRLYFHVQKQQLIEKQLLQIKQLTIKFSNNRSKIFKVKIYFLLIQINFRTNDFLKFGKCLARLKRLYDEDITYFNEQQILRLKSYNTYCYLMTNKTKYDQVLEVIKQILSSANKILKDDLLITEVYSLIMLVKIKCYEIKKQYEIANKFFDQLIKIIKICQGQNSIYLYYQNLKLQMRIRELKSQQQSQKQIKKQKITTSVNIELLSKQIYKIDSQSINLDLFQIIDNQSQFFY